MDPQLIPLVVLATLTAGMVGANNASNATATLAGAKVTTHSRAAMIFATGLLLGSLLEGGKMSGAVLGRALEGVLGSWSVGVILGVTFGMIVIATGMGLPLPVTQALYGAAIGSGIFLGTPLNLAGITVVLISWIITPVVAAGASFGIARMGRKIGTKDVRTGAIVYGILTLATGFYTAYVLGANTIGLVAGIMKGGIGWEAALALAATSSTLGGILFGRKVSTTVGERIAIMGPQTAFACQLSGALTVHLFTQAGIPVSISHAIVGGVAGGALSKGFRALNAASWARLAALWFLTPLITMVLAWVIHASAAA
ncbi:MAG: inorganic phosphate transporter [Candidatus Methanosuratincola sp.]|nr:inorganic phosphate transporter [Candidatus Methanosuratincola sp.]